MNDVLNTIPAKQGVRTVAPGEGERFDFGAVHFNWKVRSEDSSHCYTVFELDLAPGEGVDLHSHPAPETFYVLEGNMTFYRIVDGAQDTVTCGSGTTVIIPPNALHALFNLSRERCRLLDIATPAHQSFFDVVLAEDRRQPFKGQAPEESMRRAANIALDHDMYLAPYDVKTGLEIKL